MKYVLQNIDNRKFVAPSGSANSYTEKLQNAKTFPSRESAEAAACGNERALALEEAIRG
jgi:hypothetical protein